MVLTSNRARELSEALRRRCLHLFIDFPGIEQERRILELKIPNLDTRDGRGGGALRKCAAQTDLAKQPSVAETLDWVRALIELGVEEMTSRRCAPAGLSQARKRPRTGRKQDRRNNSALPPGPLMRQVLLGFFVRLREAGVRISVAESLDAVAGGSGGGPGSGSPARGAGRHP